MRVGRADRRDRAATANARDEAIRRLAEVGIRDPARRRPLPVPAVRRDAAAGRARRRAGERPEHPDRRRAVDGARRDHPAARSSRCCGRVQEARGMGLVLITHDLRVAFSICRPHLRALRRARCSRSAPARRRSSPSRCTRTRSGCCCPSRRSSAGSPSCPSIAGSVPAPDDVAGPVPVRRRAAAGRRRSARRGAPPLREVAPGAALGLRARRGDPRRARRERAAARTRAPSPSAHGARRPATRSSGSTACQKVRLRRGAGPRSRRSRTSRSRSATGESVGLVGESGSGKTTLAPLPRRPGDADAAAAIEIDGVDARDYAR